jgi:hypothetical protein
MGSGYSVIDGNVAISNERMQKIYVKYCDPSAYNAWKKQLEDTAKTSKICYNPTPKNVFILHPGDV